MYDLHRKKIEETSKMGSSDQGLANFFIVKDQRVDIWGFTSHTLPPTTT